MRRRKCRKFPVTNTLTVSFSLERDGISRLINLSNSYKVGDCFVSLPQPQVLELLGSSTEAIEVEVDALKTRLEAIQEEMGELKKALYGRFGRSINLET